MVFGLVSGSRIRSSKVETDSASFDRRSSGLKSKRNPASSGRPRIVAAKVTPTIQLRPPLEKAVERGERRIADRCLFAPRL